MYKNFQMQNEESFIYLIKFTFFLFSFLCFEEKLKISVVSFPFLMLNIYSISCISYIIISESGCGT